MNEARLSEVITQWLMQVEVLENYASGAQREELHAFIEHAVKVLDLLGQAELVKDNPNLSGIINSEFEALKKRAVRLGLVQES
jgi:hypothetical protein